MIRLELEQGTSPGGTRGGVLLAGIASNMSPGGMRTDDSIGAVVMCAMLANAAQVSAQSEEQWVVAAARELEEVGHERRAPMLRRFGNRVLHITEASAIELAKAELSSTWVDGASATAPGLPPTLARYEHLRALQRVGLADHLASMINPVQRATEILRDAFDDYRDLAQSREAVASALKAISSRHASYGRRRSELARATGARLHETQPFAVEAAVEWLSRNAEHSEEWIDLFADFLSDASVGPRKLEVIDTGKGRFLWTDEVRFALARAVREGSTVAEDRVLAMLHLMYAPDSEVQVAAIYDFANLEGFTADKLVHFGRLLHSGDPVIVREAVTALGMLGPDAEAAIPQIEKLAEHADRQVAERAKASLRQIRR